MPVRSRRHRSSRLPRGTASDVPKSIELEQRVARVELTAEHLAEALELQTKKTAALQAQLDHFMAKRSGS